MKNDASIKKLFELANFSNKKINGECYNFL